MGRKVASLFCLDRDGWVGVTGLTVNVNAPPHVLIEADRPLTLALWELAEPKPIVWSPCVLHSPMRDIKLAILRHMSPMALIPLIKKNELGENTALGNFAEIIKEAREVFTLRDDEPLTIAVVGSHTGLFANDVGGGTSRLESFSTEDLAWVKSGRSYISQFFLNLSKLAQIEIRWLGDCFPQLLPTENDNPAYTEVAKQVRILLAEPNAMQLPRGAIPHIFSQVPNSDQWKPYSDRRRRTTTNYIVNDFIEMSKNGGRYGKAVLAKLLADDIASHNPMDNPFVTCEQMQLAQLAGIESILMDKHKGIIGCRDPQCTRHPIPVVGA